VTGVFISVVKHTSDTFVHLCGFKYVIYVSFRKLIWLFSSLGGGGEGVVFSHMEWLSEDKMTFDLSYKASVHRRVIRIRGKAPIMRLSGCRVQQEEEEGGGGPRRF